MCQSWKKTCQSFNRFTRNQSPSITEKPVPSQLRKCGDINSSEKNLWNLNPAFLRYKIVQPDISNFQILRYSTIVYKGHTWEPRTWIMLSTYKRILQKRSIPMFEASLQLQNGCFPGCVGVCAACSHRLDTLVNRKRTLIQIKIA